MSFKRTLSEIVFTMDRHDILLFLDASIGANESEPFYTYHWKKYVTVLIIQNAKL